MRTLEQILKEMIDQKKTVSKIFDKENNKELYLVYLRELILLETVLYIYENQSQDEAV